MKLRYLASFIVILITTSIWGCKTTKHIGGSGNTVNISVQQLVDSVYRNAAFNLLSSKVLVSFVSEKQTRNFSARIRIKKDSIIWLSVAPVMGIELMRLSITKDSVKLINRLDQTYFSDKFEKAGEILKVNIAFPELQAALLGNYIKVYEYDYYSIEGTSNLYHLRSDSLNLRKEFQENRIPNMLQHETTVDPQTWKVKRTLLRNDLQQERYIAEYSVFHQLSNGLFPTIMNFRLDGREKMAIDLKWSKLEEKERLRFPFKIPEKYVSIK